MILSKEDKKSISENIKKVESKSGAELVAVIAQKSGDYSFVWLCFSVSLVFIFSFVAIFFLENSISLLNLQIFLLAVFYVFFLFFGENFIKFLPNFYRKRKSSLFAHEQFNSLGINRTKTRQGVMFFVSIQERYVEIIADSAIGEKIENSYWQSVVKSFLLHVKNGEFEKGYVEAMQECGDILIDKFPITSDDENELSDEVIEI